VRYRLSTALAGAVACLAATTARAQDADELGEQGKKLADTGDFVGAIARFRAAAALDDAPKHRCNLGNAFSRISDWMRAHAFLDECLARRGELDPGWAASLEKLRAYAASQLAAGGGHGRLRVERSPAGAAVSVPAVFDQRDRFVHAARLWLPAGEHEISITLEGHDPVERRVTIAPGEVAAIDVALKNTAPKPRPDPPIDEPPPPDPLPRDPPPVTGPIDSAEPPSRSPAIATLAGAGVALAGGVVFHALAVGTRGDLQGMVDSPERDALVDDLERERAIMFALYGTAAVATGIGVYLYLRARPREPEPRAVVSVAPRRITLWARF
jgi:hypothetical protein